LRSKIRQPSRSPRWRRVVSVSSRSPFTRAHAQMFPPSPRSPAVKKRDMDATVDLTAETEQRAPLRPQPLQEWRPTQPPAKRPKVASFQPYDTLSKTKADGVENGDIDKVNSVPLLFGPVLPPSTSLSLQINSMSPQKGVDALLLNAQQHATLTQQRPRITQQYAMTERFKKAPPENKSGRPFFIPKMTFVAGSQNLTYRSRSPSKQEG